MEKNPSRAAFELLRDRKEHVSFAESLTGGLIAATLISNSGASNVIDESYVTYAAESKIRILGVRRETVETVGVVSAQCAREMAEGVRKISGADWGVSATGLAGPDGGTEQTPVGTVFVGVAGADGAQAFEFHLGGDRMQVRRQAVDAALTALVRCMEGKPAADAATSDAENGTAAGAATSGAEIGQAGAATSGAEIGQAGAATSGAENGTAAGAAISGVEIGQAGAAISDIENELAVDATGSGKSDAQAAQRNTEGAQA